MKYLLLILTILPLLTVRVFAQSAADAESPPRILLAEVSLGDIESASNEFVELYNMEHHGVSLDGFLLQYKSKNGASWSTKAILSGDIGPRSRYLISNYHEPNSVGFVGGLSNTDGHLRIVDPSMVVLDLLGWGLADAPEGESIEPHHLGGSLKRIVDEDGLYVDSNNNALDWFESASPSPQFDEWNKPDSTEPTCESQNTSTAPESSSSGPESTDSNLTSSPISVAPPVSATFNITITELMPDPKSPLTDSEHEFIELFNPNKFDVNLEGYQLEAGKDWRYSYTLPKYVLKKGQYIAIFSMDSNITLSNSGSQVRLVGPNGTTLDEVVYEKAISGKSWALSQGSWSWAEPSPHKSNIVDLATANAVSANGSLNASDTSVVASTLEKQNVSFESDSTTNGGENPGSTRQFDAEESTNPINSKVLAGVGLLTLLYGIYEYRNDIRIRIQQFRRYLALRRENRQEPKRG